MSGLNLTLACGAYDRTKPVAEGKVIPEGIDLNYMELEPEELFWRMAQYSEFDASEFSLAAYLTLRGRDDDRFVGIPVFPSRMFRHSAVFINTEAGIEKAEDLKGKRIGVPDYTMTAPVWIRGIFQHDHGVKPTDVKWFTGGLNSPGRLQRIEVKWPKELEISHIGNEKTLSDMLEKGEIDALIGARQPKSYDEGSPKVAPLWPDYHTVEMDYFERTGIFPIMHLIVIKKEIYERHPWVAVSLFKAFSRAKAMCQEKIFTLSAPKYMVPGVEKLYKDIVAKMGLDYWSYGYEPNRKVLETFAQYIYEQSMTSTLVDPKDVFCPSTLKLHTI